MGIASQVFDSPQYTVPTKIYHIFKSLEFAFKVPTYMSCKLIAMNSQVSNNCIEGSPIALASINIILYTIDWLKNLN